MSNNELERGKLEQKYSILLSIKQTLSDREQDLLNYDSYFERMQWSNYGYDRIKEHELEKENLHQKKLKNEFDLVQLRQQIEQLDEVLIYARKLPKATLRLIRIDEELQCYLIDFRTQWYEKNQLNWRTHFLVFFKTCLLIIIECFLKRPLIMIIHYLFPLQKPNLPG